MTVSRVVNGSGRVRAATRRRVERAMRDLAYIPNRAARSLVVKKLGVLALVIPDISNPFFPLLASERGLGPAAIGVVFLTLGLTNTAARFPAGWLIDRTRRASLYSIAGILTASIATAVLPRADGYATTLALVAVIGTASGVAFVGISVGLAASSTPATRGFVMGGYSTSLYLGFALGSFALGPVITHYGYDVAFLFGGAVGSAGTLAAAVLWSMKRAASPG